MKKDKCPICENECLGKLWQLQESHNLGFQKMPYVKLFSCLAEARKAMVYYIRNLDFQGSKFRLRKI